MYCSGALYIRYHKDSGVFEIVGFPGALANAEMRLKSRTSWRGDTNDLIKVVILPSYVFTPVRLRSLRGKDGFGHQLHGLVTVMALHRMDLVTVRFDLTAFNLINSV